jgi:S-adenosylmethionine:tRNA ribosyltransferase-isomerase
MNDLAELYKNIEIRHYHYELPESKIAKYPLGQRDSSKLLYFKQGEIKTCEFRQLTDLLDKNDLLVFNNAKVIQARIGFVKDTGAQIEVFCLEPHNPPEYSRAFEVKHTCEWKCLVGNQKKWKSGFLKKIVVLNGRNYLLQASLTGKNGESPIIRFDWSTEGIPDQQDFATFGEILEQAGHTPLPPYLRRDAEHADKTNYQTVYASQNGSVAAPTAGLHFSEQVLEAFVHKGIQSETLTLHVGAGTFKPVKSQTIEGHEMHTEHFEIGYTNLKKILSHKGRIIAVGTTSVRTLESIHHMGAKLLEKRDNPFHVSQWEVYEYPDNFDYFKTFSAVADYMQENQLQTLSASTGILIVPGYRFKTISGLVTNFHQPQSTLLLLIAAAVGEEWQRIYSYALANNFRFLSYGDSSLLIL